MVTFVMVTHPLHLFGDTHRVQVQGNTIHTSYK
jgi:hypothetical protein